MSASSFFPSGAPGPKQLPDPATVPMTPHVVIRVTDPAGDQHLASGDPAIARRVNWDLASAHPMSGRTTLGQFRRAHPSDTFSHPHPAIPNQTIEADYSSVRHLPDDSTVEVCVLLIPDGGPIPLAGSEPH